MLWQAPAWRAELRQLLLLLANRADHRLHPLPWTLPIPVRVHGRYSRAEIEAAHCFSTRRLRLRRSLAAMASSPPTPPGSTAKACSLTSPAPPTCCSSPCAYLAAGQRYIHHAARGSRVLLYRCAEAFGYVREQRRQGRVTEPFVCLGFARYESHEGERPMAIRWRLERELPAAWLPGCSSPSLALAV